MRRKTLEEEAWLEQMYPTTKTHKIVSEFEKRFGWSLSESSISSWANSRDLKKVERWTDEVKAYLREIVPGRSHREISALMSERFGTYFDADKVKGAINRYHLNTGRTGFFEKGDEPANKGKSWDEQGLPEEVRERMRTTCFKPGSIPSNHRPVGSERIGKDGYVWTKVRDTFDPSGYGDWRDLWKPKHRAVWERENGPLPEGMIVVFVDGDIHNFDPDNLMAMTKANHMVICHQGIAYADRDSCEAALAIAQLQQKVYEKRTRPRKCRDCGCEFKPEQPRQARCRKCIERRKNEYF